MYKDEKFDLSNKEKAQARAEAKKVLLFFRGTKIKDSLYFLSLVPFK
jgi:hypothetical protein